MNVRDYDKIICVVGIWFDDCRYRNIINDNNGESERAYAAHRDNTLWNKYNYMKELFEAFERGEYDV